ncbi:MAG: hypothetical protein ACQETE_09340 [Bacteroidota bacterium]
MNIGHIIYSYLAAGSTATEDPGSPEPWVELEKGDLPLTATEENTFMFCNRPDLVGKNGSWLSLAVRTSFRFAQTYANRWNIPPDLIGKHRQFAL